MTIRFGVVGAGHIGKRHAEMIVRNHEAELVAIADIRDKDQLGVEQYDVPVFSSLEDMLANSPEFDVLCVATPNGLHAEHALAGLRPKNMWLLKNLWRLQR